MAVSVAAGFALFPRGGPLDKRFPLGYFFGLATVAGDASAGTATATFSWDGVPDLVFDITHVQCFEDVNIGRTYTIRVNTQQFGREDLQLIYSYVRAGTGSSASASGNMDFTPAMLSFKPRAAWNMTIVSTNPGAGVTVRYTVIGTLWDAQGLKLPGFPGTSGIQLVYPVPT